MANHPLRRYPDVPHYYGDYVRALFLAVAVLAFIAIPVWGDLLPFGLWAQIGAMVLLLLLAALTSPHGKFAMWLNAAVAGLGVILLEAVAVSLYSFQSTELFVVRELSVVALAFAFYWSVKTLRAMIQGKLGKIERPWEFENSSK